MALPNLIAVLGVGRRKKKLVPMPWMHLMHATCPSHQIGEKVILRWWIEFWQPGMLYWNLGYRKSFRFGISFASYAQYFK